jgi:AbiV family abortive infection protein
MATLTQENLLHGAFYALEQAGRLVNDAVALFEQQRYPSSVVLAVFAREEVGRYRMLLEARDETIDLDVRLTPKELRDKFKCHEEKIKNGISGTFYEYFEDQDPELTKLKAELDPATYQRRHERIISKRMERKAKTAHKDTQAFRERALYVDLIGDTTNWSRPASVTAKEAFGLLQEVTNDYLRAFATIRDRLPGRDAELGKAFDAWPDHPSLPEPLPPERWRQIMERGGV